MKTTDNVSATPNFSTSWTISFIIGIYFLIIDLDSSSSVKEQNIHFYLWHNTTEKEKVHINYYGSNCTDAPLKILVHGWLNTSDIHKFKTHSYWYKGATVPYVRNGSHVVTVNWTHYGKRPYVFSTTSKASHIAHVISRFIIGFCKTCGTTYNNVHVIGHSLGAEIAFLAGKHIQSMVKGASLGRITGLDPTGTTTNVFYEDDAISTDTIISDGNITSVGLVNFWINDTENFTLPFPHYYSALTFLEGILSDKLEGWYCASHEDLREGLCFNNSRNTLGENVDFSKPGDFFLDISYDDLYNVFLEKYWSGNWIKK